MSGFTQKKYDAFGLTLMVNHACNLRCSYCYTGAKFSAPMSKATGRAAIGRSLRSLNPGGRLDLGFFGGEPLLEAERILEWMQRAREEATGGGSNVRFNLTTNGTITSSVAWEVMLATDLELVVSFDGKPELHDRHRRDVHGHGSSTAVLATLSALSESGKKCRVLTVVRPDNLEEIPEAVDYLFQFGVHQVDLSLDLWTTWTAGDGVRLEALVRTLANLWQERLPELSLNWFDAKAAQLAHLPATDKATRCGFGSGEMAVAPSGRLYPCERLIGEDRPGNSLCLPGHALDGEDFLEYFRADFEPCSACARCAIASSCETTCRCSNFIRTGDVNRPDGLLCILNKATTRAVADFLERASVPSSLCNNPTKIYA